MRNLFRSGRRRVCGAALLGSCLVAFAAAPDSGGQTPKPKEFGLIFLQDGFAVQGYVKRETSTEVDPLSKTTVEIPKGCFLLDDGPRRIYLSHNYVRLVEKKDPPRDEVVIHKRAKALKGRLQLPNITAVLDVSNWDDAWERTFKVKIKPNVMSGDRVTEVPIPQHLSELTSTYARVDATDFYYWSSVYLTRELAPETVRRLLGSHPDFVDKRELPEKDRIERRLRYATFMTQAGWYDQAEEALQQAIQDFPGSKEKFEAQLAVVGGLHTRERFEELKRLHLSGQHESVRQRIEKFPQKYASAQTQSGLLSLKGEYDEAAGKVKQAQKYLADLPKEVPDRRRATFAEAAQAVRDELAYDNVNRLEIFLGQAAQAERLRKDGKKPNVAADELLSLAISGWLLGSTSAQANPENALRLWGLRQFVLEYEKTQDVNLRQKMVSSHLKESDEAAVLDEAWQMIPNLPPAEPAAETTTKQTEVKAGRHTVYQLKLPPEYKHGRHYPVLIALHQAGEKADDMMARWREQAADNGYILAAPEWESGNGGYTYGKREHLSVLETIRDLRRRYRVDSDRIFLFGLKEGGLMALDVGLSHPDLFAGVATMAAAPEKFSEVYWHNGQYLPFYIVNGDRADKGSLERMKRVFNSWAGKSYPMLWVQYKGRCAEWYGGEVANIFEWMRAKRRALPLHRLGNDGQGQPFGTEYFSMRPTDNSYYWLTTNDVSPLCWNDFTRWNPGVHPAQLQATVFTEDNDIRVRAVGVKQVTVWLARNAKGESTIDFDKPVSVRVNNKQVLNKKTVKPSLGVMLEDLYQRGDRQRLFLGKIDATP